MSIKQPCRAGCVIGLFEFVEDKLKAKRPEWVWKPRNWCSQFEGNSEITLTDSAPLHLTVAVGIPVTHPDNLRLALPKHLAQIFGNGH